MRLPGKSRSIAAARWIRSRAGPRAVVLGYHRVAEEGQDPLRLCTPPSVLERHLQAIRRHGRPVRLLDLAAATGSGHPPPGAVAVTFDDGYADVLLAAKPLLERYEIPATVFVVTGYLGREPTRSHVHVVSPDVRGKTLEIRKERGAPDSESAQLGS